MDGLTVTGPKSYQTIHASIEEIVGKCFIRDKVTGEYSVNVGFGMKLKSHGALGIIFESLNDTNDPIVLNNLILLITSLLYDVRRLDFFFKPELAIKIAKHCFTVIDIELSVIEMLKCTQVFNKKSSENGHVLIYVAIWILSKWAFSSVTTSTSTSARTSMSTSTSTSASTSASIVSSKTAVTPSPLNQSSAIDVEEVRTKRSKGLSIAPVSAINTSNSVYGSRGTATKRTRG